MASIWDLPRRKETRGSAMPEPRARMLQVLGLLGTPFPTSGELGTSALYRGGKMDAMAGGPTRSEFQDEQIRKVSDLGLNLFGIVKNKKMVQEALEQFGKTFNPRETGYVLDNGTRLDFSGRHYGTGYEKTGPATYRPKAGQPDYLVGQRNVDHRELHPIEVKGLLEFIDQTGAVRYMPEQGVSFVDTNMPSRKQLETVVRDFRSSQTPMNVDVDSLATGNTVTTKEFERPTVDSLEAYLKQFIAVDPAQRIKDLQKQKDFILKHGKLPPGVETKLDRSSYYEQIDDELGGLQKQIVRMEGGPAMMVAPKKLEQGLVGEPGYVYHATNADRLNEILTTGKLNTHKPWDFTEQDFWPDGSTAKRAYFGKGPENLWQFAPPEGEPVVVRAKESAAKFKRESTGDIFTEKPIGAKNLEFLGDDGVWHPLTDLNK